MPVEQAVLSAKTRGQLEQVVARAEWIKKTYWHRIVEGKGIRLPAQVIKDHNAMALRMIPFLLDLLGEEEIPVLDLCRAPEFEFQKGAAPVDLEI